MPRITLLNVANSFLPERIGICATDLSTLAKYTNLAQERLITACGEQGAFGGYYETAFEVVRCTSPYITLPPEIARIIAADVCRTPIRIENQWFQYLYAGQGRLTECMAKRGAGSLQANDRGYFPTAYDLTSSNQYLRLYATDARDYGAEIWFAGAKDQNDLGIYLGGNGFSLTLASPFVTSTFIVTSFTGIQKPRTYGDVLLKQVDATTGVESLLARFTPDETNPSYRRYLLGGLPKNCCDPNNESATVQITALCKLQYIPAVRANDFLIIQSIPALIEECQAIRYEGMDTPNSAQLALVRHNKAMSLLNQQINHESGITNPAIQLSPWGTARLDCAGIGSMV